MPDKHNSILWTVDPFYTTLSKRSHLPEVIAAWNHGEEAPVEPVFILNDVTEKESWAHPSAEAEIRKITEPYHIPNLRPPKIIKNVEPPFTTKKLVGELNDYADKIGAQLIVVHSSNQKSPVRLLLGSFAETLIQTSSKPILLLNSEMAPLKAINKIMVATDLESTSEAAYQFIKEKAKKLSASLVFFTQCPSKFSSESEPQLKNWVEQAQQEGIDAEYLIGEGKGNKAQAILKCAKAEGADMIAMRSRSGTPGSHFLGNTTLQVARQTDTPLLIWYPTH